MHAYLACFDVSDDRARSRLARRLEHFGLRVQYSVFEISVGDRAELERLRHELAELLEPGDDLRFYALCRQCRCASVDHRGRRIAEFPAAVVI